MKRIRFTEEQIIAVLREHEAGAKAADLCQLPPPSMLESLIRSPICVLPSHNSHRMAERCDIRVTGRQRHRAQTKFAAASSRWPEKGGDHLRPGVEGRRNCVQHL